MGKIEFNTIPPRVSCVDLARSLVELWKQREELDAARLHFTKNSMEYHNVNRLFYAVASRIDSVDDMILKTPALTLQDSVAKMMLVTSRLIGEFEDDSLGCCLLDAFFVVAQAAGVEPESIASSQYIPPGFQPNTLEAL